MQIGPLEILVILVIALLIFGPDKLPEMARTVGKGVREVRKFQRMVQGELEDVMSEPASSDRRSTAAPDTEPVEPVETVDAVSGDAGSGNGASGSGNGASGNGASGNGAAPEGGTGGESRGADPAPEAGRDSD